MPAPRPGARSAVILRQAPGLRPWVDAHVSGIAGVGPTRKLHNVEGRLLWVTGNALVEVTPAGVMVPRGTIPGVERVSMAHNQQGLGHEVLTVNGQAGYVLEPWQQVEVRGWRKSHADIAEFYFTDLPDSYAARTGRPDNVGVIGVAAFRERRVAPAYLPPPSPSIAAETRAEGGALAKSAESARERHSSADAAAPQARQQLGAGHGARRYDPVAQTQFERDSRWPNQRIALYYDSWEALAARGVIAPESRHGPDPFPLGFVPDPR